MSLTESQRCARRAILTALKEVKKQADASWRADKDEFVAHFHLSCIKNETIQMCGKPALSAMDHPIYAYGRSRTPQGCAEGGE